MYKVFNVSGYSTAQGMSFSVSANMGVSENRGA